MMLKLLIIIRNDDYEKDPERYILSGVVFRKIN